MKNQHYIVWVDVFRWPVWCRVYVVIGPQGQLYSAFDRDEALHYREVLAVYFKPNVREQGAGHK